jgi:cyclophilin family peptidyl-prolyl cis-trans isomerase
LPGTAVADRKDFPLNTGSEFPLTRLLALFAVAFLALAPIGAEAQTLDPENTIYLQLTAGRVVIKLRPDLAPNHVERVKELTRAKFYDGLTFHRVIPGFSDKPDLRAEIKPVHFGRGAIGAARGPDPDSANSQFFICLGDAEWLDGGYTQWGEVVEGMEFVDKIKQGNPDIEDGRVKDPDKIVTMRVAADVK